MKRIALLALVGIFCQCAFSQNFVEKLRCQTEIAVGFPLPESHGTPMRLCLKVMYGLNPRLMCGVGAGISRYDKTLVPLFADLQWSVARPRQFTPFVEARVGYSFAPSPSATGGSNLGLGFGTSFRLSGAHRLYASVGYEYQHFSLLKTFESAVVRSRFVEKIGHNALSVTIGFQF
ncbi:MAG: hypothetical protein J6M59_00135 [Bacteroidaceae bacterium]|nr:hypothetical protein [Bacteroidaceae bacterium]